MKGTRPKGRSQTYYQKPLQLNQIWSHTHENKSFMWAKYLNVKLETGISKKYPLETSIVLLFFWFNHKGIDTSLTENPNPWHQS